MILPNSKPAFEALRRKAEKVARLPEHRPEVGTPVDFAYALEELRIYSAELEIQNDDLQESRIQTEELQTRYFRHFDLAPVGMIRLNDKEMILDANILGARMLGKDRARLRSGKLPFAAHLTRDSRSPFWSHVKKAHASSEMESCEISLRGRDGQETFVRMQSISSAGGEGATDLFATLTDLTEHRRAEVHRLELERKLLGRQKLENIGTLAGGIAHDLNNILQVINSSLDIAKKKTTADLALLKHITDAREASDRATNLSQRLLTFSKGGSPIKQIVSVREILGSSVAFWLTGSKLQLDLSIAPDLLPVLVDPVQFAQVIENVVINARESKRHSGKLFVRAKNVFPGAADEHLPFVQIEIEDQGGGIPEYIRDKIFDICFTTKAGGSGIGLATTKSIMDQHGGRIEVKSVAGQGTTVSLLLPAIEQQFVPPASLCADALAKGIGRILIIDDEEMILEVIPLIVEGLGYDSATAKEGKEGCEVYRLAMAEGRPFAAVLLDATIPGGLGGEAALKRLLKVDPHARVILFSGYSDSDLMTKAEEVGFKGRLAKPFTVPQLAAVLNGVLS
jgi:signal transduction histidine kinase/ActR/RegA family two-component response regulator